MSQENLKKPKKSEYDFVTPFVALLVLGFIGYGAQYWYNNVRKPSSYSVCFTGANYTDKAISDFYVNGLAGGRIDPKHGDFPYGEGGGGCTGTVSGETATVRWEYSLPHWQDYEKHIKPETHEVTVPMPIAESNHSRYFEVRIFSDNHVELQLTDLPAPDRNPEEGALVRKLVDGEIKAASVGAQDKADAEIAEEKVNAKKFEDDNAAAYKRYQEEYNKQHPVAAKEQK